ncbi:MAG TPA: 23S rRNA (pseudouridine(1915)-N(3))-methyltransferase RlmH [Candidatus Peribacteraceae bacterium]|nr:23S rRNA (pseudouridine(1915)-N(3))-methyltransferase RlmH [Candidatus Peribacteraceae bacterium]
MLKVVLLCIGKVKAGWIKDGCDDYLNRLQSVLKISVTEIPDSTAKNPDLKIAEESERIIHWADQYNGDIWVLDEKGTLKTSVEFSKVIEDAKDYGRPLLFVIGGPYGVTDAVRKLAKGNLSVSKMTLTHELCRVFLLEQIYRATEIQKGSGYHH